MKINKFIKFFSIFVMLQFTTTVFAQKKSDTTAIQNILLEEIVSWNKGDAEMYSRHFAEDGTFTNIMGVFAVGHKIFQEKHDQIFKTVFLGTELKQEVVSLKFVHPNVATVETIGWVSGFKNGPMKGTTLDDKGRLRVRLLQVMVKDRKDWKIVTYHNVDIKPGVPAPEPQ
ncbi:MAG: SgcJ/EcaC family oxidoreductase [Sediminibacterium sp.]|uniref:SgcJ/EcaC family oxidoreductase n=1 Tax=Flavobacterium sp. TaxID=239 RepID=UPI003263A927